MGSINKQHRLPLLILVGAFAILSIPSPPIPTSGHLTQPATTTPSAFAYLPLVRRDTSPFSAATPTPTSTATAAPTSNPTSPPSPTPTTEPVSALHIAALRYDARDEYVEITNPRPIAQDLSDWRLLSVVGTQIYDFPAGYTLAPHGSVRIHTGPDAFSNPPDHLLWTTAYIWNNDGDKAELRDPAGQLIDSYCYKAGCP